MSILKGQKLSRRDLLKFGTAGVGIALAPSILNSQSASAVTPSNALWIPPAISGKNFNLKLQKSTKQMLSGALTKTYSYNGTGYWGPTLIMKKGDDISLNVTNNLSEQTTTHWHGIHLPAEMDGGPMQVIEIGKTWSPKFKMMNNASTYWYHPHMHKTTQKQLALGAGGFIIVQDAVEAALALPHTLAVPCPLSG